MTLTTGPQARATAYPNFDDPDNPPACRNKPLGWFYPPAGIEGHAFADLAKSICEDCPVRRPCLLWALETGEDHGVWGGATAKERRKMRRRRGGS